MSERRKLCRFDVVVCATLLCLAGSYPAAYLCTVEPNPTLSLVAGGVVVRPVYSINGSRIDNEFWDRLFAPANWIDRKIRGDMWVLE